jgi:hypothetical protein
MIARLRRFWSMLRYPPLATVTVSSTRGFQAGSTISFESQTGHLAPWRVAAVASDTRLILRRPWLREIASAWKDSAR